MKRQRIDITPLPGKNALDIHVEPASRAANIFGLVLTPLGGGVVYASFFMALVNFGRDHGWDVASESLAASGAAMTLVGLMMMGMCQTTVTF